MIREFTVDALTVRVVPAEHFAQVTADHAASALRSAIDGRGVAHAMFATGNSQLAFLEVLVQRRDVDWSSIVGFHLDEYVGISPEHPASFRRYLRERLVAPTGLREFHELAGDAEDLDAECTRYAALLRDLPLDLCCVGIGENGHLAFNDPGVADFHDPLDVKVVELDDAGRRQQVGEGHFPDVDAVPRRAITVTIPALLRTRSLLAIVPEGRKRAAVQDALHGPVDEACPASILRQQPHATLYLDADSAAAV